MYDVHLQCFPPARTPTLWDGQWHMYDVVALEGSICVRPHDMRQLKVVQMDGFLRQQCHAKAVTQTCTTWWLMIVTS